MREPILLVSGLCFLLSGLVLLPNKSLAVTGESSPYDNIDQVVLIFPKAQWSFREAVVCQGIEEKCADNYIAKLPENMKLTSVRDKYIARLKDHLKNYPMPLREESLRAAMTDFINKHFKSIKDIVDLGSSFEHLDKYTGKPNTLIILTKVVIHKDMEPPLAILQVEVGPIHRGKRAHVSAIPIPLNLPETEIAKRLSSSLKGLGMSAVPKSEDSSDLPIDPEFLRLLKH